MRSATRACLKLGHDPRTRGDPASRDRWRTCLLLEPALNELQIAVQLAPEPSDRRLELGLARGTDGPLVDASRMAADDAASRAARDAGRQGRRDQQAAHPGDDPLAE